MHWDYWIYRVHHWNTTDYNRNTPGYHWSLVHHWEAQLLTIGNTGIPLVLLEYPRKRAPLDGETY
jgi:hypothetical protein